MEPEQGRVVREIEILGLQREAAEAAGGELTSWEEEDTPLEVREAYWKNIVAYERAPWTTHREELAQDGVELLPPDELTDDQLPSVLWSLIRALAERSIFLHSTNHLSDRELYTWLWGEGLSEETKSLPRGSGWSRHLDLIGSGSEEHNLLYLRYYADEGTRQWWKQSFPDYQLPPHEDPPYDRDRYLPDWDPTSVDAEIVEIEVEDLGDGAEGLGSGG